METSSDRTQPYPIKLPSQHSSGELRVGWRSFPVNLIDISWNAITVDLPLGTAKRLRLNSKATVLYQGNYWHTRIVEKATRNGNRAILSMCLAENDDPRVQRLKNKKTVFGSRVRRTGFKLRSSGPRCLDCRLLVDDVDNDEYRLGWQWYVAHTSHRRLLPRHQDYLLELFLVILMLLQFKMP